jgi:ureidoacrylate peracid hydrolase
MNPKETAIILVEYQNDFTTPGGIFYDALKAVIENTNMLSHSASVIERARKLGVKIVHLPIFFAEGYPELPSKPYGILKGVAEAKAFRAGTWGAEITASVPRDASDIVIEGKRGLDGFASTGLDFVLRNNGIQTIAIAGFLTNCCVEGTARSGYEKGYNVVTLSDCTATFSEEQQHAALTYTLPMFSQVISHQQFLKQLTA